jgi:hypothetical protein
MFVSGNLIGGLGNQLFILNAVIEYELLIFQSVAPLLLSINGKYFSKFDINK